jgi:hypothetical protein
LTGEKGPDLFVFNAGFGNDILTAAHQALADPTSMAGTPLR